VIISDCLVDGCKSIEKRNHNQPLSPTLMQIVDNFFILWAEMQQNSHQRLLM
jgi:hypothetical protein